VGVKDQVHRFSVEDAPNLCDLGGAGRNPLQERDDEQDGSTVADICSLGL